MNINEALKQIKFPIDDIAYIRHSKYKIIDKTLIGERTYYGGAIKSWKHLYELFEINKKKLVMDICPINKNYKSAFVFIIGTPEDIYYYKEETNEPYRTRVVKMSIYVPNAHELDPMIINLVEKL